MCYIPNDWKLSQNYVEPFTFVRSLILLELQPSKEVSFFSVQILEDMFQLIVMPQGIEKVTIQLKDTPTKVYAIGAKLFLSKVPLEVLQN